MKTTIYKFLLMLPFALLFSCDDWLRELPAGTQTLDEYYVSGATCEPVITACYVPMMWQFYGGKFINEWFIGDVCSDDAVKGGQFISDDPDVYEMETFRVNAENDMLLNYYHAQYVGIARCNRAIQDIPKVATDEYMDAVTQARYVAEAKFLRAFYYLRLVRLFGNVVYYDYVIEGSDQLKLQRSPLSEVYCKIIADLKSAEIFLWEKSEYAEADLGRATKGAAQALLLKTYLTGHQYLDNAYAEAEYWGEQIYKSGEYTLCDNYWDNFSLAGENGPESVFEIQYTNDPTGDWGPGGTRGSANAKMQRCRSSTYTSGSVGWGYNRPTQDLINEYEANDPRKNMTIHSLIDSDGANNETDNKQVDWYDGKISTVSLKYAMMTDGDGGNIYKLDANNLRDPINTKEIRYADVLLMYAEACCKNGNTTMAKTLLEEVRDRARHGDGSILPEFGTPGYTLTNDLETAIRHERRVELAMEGHRWFDINRWGIAADIMNAYGQTAEIKNLYPKMATFQKGVHEIFPIPAEERRLTGIDQNPGY